MNMYLLKTGTIQQYSYGKFNKQIFTTEFVTGKFPYYVV